MDKFNKSLSLFNISLSYKYIMEFTTNTFEFWHTWQGIYISIQRLLYSVKKDLVEADKPYFPMIDVASTITSRPLASKDQDGAVDVSLAKIKDVQSQLLHPVEK